MRTRSWSRPNRAAGSPGPSQRPYSLVLTVGLWLGYAWTQTRYYIGEFDSRVAIYNGVSQRLGPIQLSTLEAVTDIRMDSLPQFSQQRVRQTVPARDLYDAQRIVKNLEGTGTIAPSDECLTASPTPAPATATASPTATATKAPATPPRPHRRRAPPTLRRRPALPRRPARPSPVRWDNEPAQHHPQTPAQRGAVAAGPCPLRRHRRQHAGGRGPGEGVRLGLLVPVQPPGGRPRWSSTWSCASGRNMPIR